MVVEAAKRLISVEEYYKMAEVGILKPGDRVELINGEIFEKSPIGSKHAALVDRLARILNQLLQGKASIRIQNPIRIDSKNEPEPDITILHYRQDDYAAAHPKASDVHIVIEVADTSIKYDREIKMPLYATCQIQEYWIIDLASEEIMAAGQPTGNDYSVKKIYKRGDVLKVLGKTLNTNDILDF